MKKVLILAAILCLMFSVSPVMAGTWGGGPGQGGGTCQGSDCGYTGEGGGGSVGDIDNSNHNSNFNSNMNSNYNSNKNTNLNNNYNKNTNMNMQGQAQGQAQAQGQSQSVENSGNSFNSNKNYNAGNKQEVTVEGDTYEAKRDMVGAPTIGVPNTGVYTEQSTPTGNLQKMQNILIFQYEFTYKQLKALAAYNLPVSERAKVRAKYYATDDDADLTDDTRITAILVETDKEGNITRPAGEYTPAVHITVEGKSSTTTVSAFAKAAIAAMKGHCDKIIITGEGSKKMMEAGGFGLMLGTSVMTLSDGAKNATATASVGGLGYASAWAGYGYCPWLQAVGAISR